VLKFWLHKYRALKAFVNTNAFLIASHLNPLMHGYDRVWQQ